MKDFKQHFFEKASQIRFSGILAAKNYDQAKAILQTLNPHQLGEGYFSAVFNSKDGGKLVVKLSDSAIDGTYYYLKLADKIKFQNKHTPRIAAIQPFQEGSGYIAVMEYLDFSESLNDIVWRVDEWAAREKKSIFDQSHWRDLMFGMIEWFENQDETNSIYEKFIEIFPEMHNLFQMMWNDPSIDMTSLDIHGGNVANRNGKVPVLVDPIGGYYSSSYNPNP